MARRSAELEFLVVADGKPLLTPSDLRNYILKRPKAEQGSEPWMTATGAVIMAAEERGPIMHAHIGMNQAINGPKPEGLPRPGAKKAHLARPKPNDA